MEFSKQCLWDFCFSEVLCCQDTPGEDVKRRHIERTSYSEYPESVPCILSILIYPTLLLFAEGKLLEPRVSNNKLPREQKTCIIRRAIHA